MHDTDREWDELNRDEARVKWTLAILIAILLSTFAWFAVGAPAPLPRPVPAPRLVLRLTTADLTGEHVLLWGVAEWRLSLTRRGDYIARTTGGATWAGAWFVDPEGRLCVSESFLADDGTRGGEIRWKVTWRKVKGRINPCCPEGDVERPDGTSATRVSLRRAKK